MICLTQVSHYSSCSTHVMLVRIW